jgi:hypothetical protein
MVECERPNSGRAYAFGEGLEDEGDGEERVEGREDWYSGDEEERRGACDEEESSSLKGLKEEEGSKEAGDDREEVRSRVGREYRSDEEDDVYGMDLEWEELGRSNDLAGALEVERGSE